MQASKTTDIPTRPSRVFLNNTSLTEDQINTSPDTIREYGKDWLKLYEPSAAGVLFPSSTEQVQEVMRVAYEHNIAIVPSGGRTGLSGGATAIQGEWVLSLDRLRSTLEICPIDFTARCSAGITTQQLQEAAEAEGLYFPVDFASKGTSQIGGTIATNAGGIRVIKYGCMRQWVLGLTVVTADGTLLNLNGSLYKNQTGLSLVSLICGSEGTLGIVTEATLRLTTPPGELMRALCGIEDISKVLPLLGEARKQFGEVSAFELFPRAGLEKVLSHHPVKDPFEEQYPWYVLIELEQVTESKRNAAEEALFELLENETLAWVVLSHNQKQLEQLLAFRELLPETLTTHYVVHKNDVSVPIPAVEEFYTELEALIKERYPTFEVIVFGHIGDGNLHVNVVKPDELAVDDFKRQCKQCDSEVLGLVGKYRGSISAEHGVGLLKRDFVHLSRSEAELELMRKIKLAFDPKLLLNPGKVYPEKKST